MTAKIQQNISPRRRSQPRLERGQQGAMSQSTVTVGFAVVAIVSLMVLGFLYLQQIFGTAAHGSSIQSLEQGLLQLKEQQKELELQGAQLRSIQSVEERVEQLNLISASNVGYLAPRSSRVAYGGTRQPF